MSVFKRKTSRGETSEYHYKFMQNGKNYYGVCEGCTTEEQAREFEARLKRISKEAAQQRSPVALVENFRQELTGGRTITLAEAFRLAMAKPRKRKLPPDKILRKSNQWEDFRQFMTKNYPEIETLPEVTRSHAEAYIAYIRQNGRFSTHYIYQAYGKRIKRRAHVAGNDKALHGTFHNGSKARVHGADVRLHGRGGRGTNFELL